MNGRYASTTTVPVAKSRLEIEDTLQRFGADKFAYMTERREAGEVAVIAFCVEERNVRLLLSLPSRDDEEFWRTPGGRKRRNKDQAFRAWEQECRRMWRSLSAVIKAKLVAVEDGISTIEREFLADIMLPDGNTVGEHVEHRIQQSYDGGKSIPLLPGLTTGSRNG